MDNHEYEGLIPWNMDTLKMVSPVTPWLKSANGKKFPASCLRFYDRFKYIELHAEDSQGFQRFLDIPELNIVQDIYVTMCDTGRDIFQSKKCIDGDEGLNEAGARFSVIDPLIKAVSQLTGWKLKWESKVSFSDLYAAANAVGMEYVFDVSEKSTSDYSLYVAVRNRKVRMVIVEAENDKTLDDDSVAQTIGYFYASKANCLGRPPVALIMMESKCRFVFFPFQDRHCVYAEAIVTDSFDLFVDHKRGNHKSGHRNFEALIVFTSRCLMAKQFNCLSKSVTKPELSKKDDFKESIIEHEEFVKTLNDNMLKDKLWNNEAEKQALIQQAEAEKQALIQQVEAEKQALIQHTEAEKQALIQHAEAEKQALIEEKQALIAQAEERKQMLAEKLNMSVEQVNEMLESPPAKRPRHHQSTI